MANTLKFGNGVWANKEGSTLAYNDENGNFKPLPFNFTRATSATRVNKQGLIEVVRNNKPRIDYKDSTKGALLLEPSRTNLLTYSEQLSNWTNIQYVTVTDNDIVSPDGNQTASRINETTDNAVHRIFLNPTVANAQHSFSVFMKAGTRDWCYLRLDSQSSDRAWFNIKDGVIGTVDSDLTASIEDYGNGWFRCTVVSQGVTFDTTPLGIIAITTGDNVQSYVGDVNEYIYAWGAQLEVGSYATSYIPTVSAVTRVADSNTQTPPSGIIGQTEGTLFVDVDLTVKPEAGSPIVGLLSLNNNVNNLQNTIILGVERRFDGTNRFYPLVQVANSTTAFIIGSNLTNGNYKAAFAYKQNDFVLYVNGVQVGTDTTGAVPSTSEILIGQRYSSDSVKISDGIKNCKIYNTRLTNAELQSLTTL